MPQKIKVLLLGLIAFAFSIYGYVLCERTVENFQKSEQCFRNVTYELSPLFDAHTLLIVDSHVKTAHGLMSFEEFCENMNIAETKIKKALRNYEKNLVSESEKEMFLMLEQKCEDTLDYMKKVKKICQEKNKAEIEVLISNGELYGNTDPTLELINEVLEKELLLSAEYNSRSIKSLKDFEKFLTMFMGFSMVLSVAGFFPTKSEKKTKKRVK